MQSFPLQCKNSIIYSLRDRPEPLSLSKVWTLGPGKARYTEHWQLFLFSFMAPPPIPRMLLPGSQFGQGLIWPNILSFSL